MLPDDPLTPIDRPTADPAPVPSQLTVPLPGPARGRRVPVLSRAIALVALLTGGALFMSG